MSKYCSTFLPDLAIPVDTKSLPDIMTDNRISAALYLPAHYIDLHTEIKKNLAVFLTNNNAAAPDFKILDDYSPINPKKVSLKNINHGKNFFKLQETPLTRPIDKIYYSV